MISNLINMQNITLKNLETITHPQTKMMFWFLFASSRGAPTRIRIIKLLQNQPYNTHQISQELAMEYKGVKHHLNILEKNNLIRKFDATYGGMYFLLPLFEENQNLFNEIALKCKC